jgi:putative heme-binding domain-containing protein
MYFVSGGRGLASDLFRVSYVGDEPTGPVDAHDNRFAELRELRHKIESYQRPVNDAAAAVEFLWPYLGHEDRFIRYAARVALEFQPVDLWQQRILSAENTSGNSPATVISAAVALARQGNESVEPELLAALARLKWDDLSTEQKLDLLRAYQLVFIRMGAPATATNQRLVEYFERLYPADDDSLNRELCNLLVYLQSPNVVKKTTPLLAKKATSGDSAGGNNAEVDKLIARGNDKYQQPIADMLKTKPDGQRLHYFFALRNAKTGWSPEDRKAYYDFLHEAEKWGGGASFPGFLVNIERDAFENATEAERLAIEGAGWRKPSVPEALPTPKGPGRERNVDDLLQLTETGLTRRNFKNGKEAFAAARCIMCHYYNGEGGATGPDLTQLAGRFSAKDLAEAIVEPSKVVSDRYRESIFIVNGVPKKGRILSETDETITLLTDAEDATKTEEISKGDIEEPPTHSTISLMPADLLKPLNDQEVLDLFAYLLSRGNPNDRMFRRR